LSALLANAVHADWLLLLTDVDGFFVPNGKNKPRLVRVVRRVTAALEAQCNGKSELGRGGMISKLKAAKLASEAGVHVAIVNGRHPEGIRLAMQHKIGTYFPPRRRKTERSG
ncbi:MAG TPA: glutamate 5-kinase, partial [Candidatus Sulfotelmatobacter sp.]